MATSSTPREQTSVPAFFNAPSGTWNTTRAPVSVALMEAFLELAREAGPAAWVASALGIAAMLISPFAIIAAFDDEPSARPFIAVLASLALLAALAGTLGSILAPRASPSTSEFNTLRMAVDARKPAKVGFTVALIPLLAALVATARRPGLRRSLAALMLISTLTVTTAGARGLRTPRGPFDVNDEKAWHLLEALDANDCHRLSLALDDYWRPFNPLEWPRVMREPIPAALDARWKPAAVACMATWISRLDASVPHRGEVERLRQSVLLQDDAQRRALLQWTPRIVAALQAETTPELTGTLRKHRAELLRCYGATPSASIDVNFTIRGDGSVINATADHSRVGKCLVTTLSSMKFPPPPSGLQTTVKHTFEVRFD